MHNYIVDTHCHLDLIEEKGITIEEVLKNCEEKKLKILQTICTKITISIFRTGSVLIVGKCDENVLMIIYNFLKILFNNEFHNISQKSSSEDKIMANKNKVKKVRRKNITIEVSL